MLKTNSSQNFNPTDPEIVPSPANTEMVIVPRATIFQMETESELKPVSDHQFFSLFPSVFRLLGFASSFLVLAFVFFHKLTNFPDLSANPGYWKSLTFNIFILGFLIRIASRKKREDQFLNRMRINAFARATLFVLITGCLGYNPFFIQLAAEVTIQFLVIKIIVTFQIFYWMDKYSLYQKLKHFTGLLFHPFRTIKLVYDTVRQLPRTIKSIPQKLIQIWQWVKMLPGRFVSMIVMVWVMLWSDFKDDIRTIRNYITENGNNLIAKLRDKQIDNEKLDKG